VTQCAVMPGCARPCAALICIETHHGSQACMVFEQLDILRAAVWAVGQNTIVVTRDYILLCVPEGPCWSELMVSGSVNRRSVV